MLVNFFRITEVRDNMWRQQEQRKDNGKLFSTAKRFKGLFTFWHWTDWFQSPFCHLQTTDNSFYLNSSHVNMRVIMVFHSTVKMIKRNVFVKSQANSKIHLMLAVIFFLSFKCHLLLEYFCLDIFEIWNKNGF